MRRHIPGLHSVQQDPGAILTDCFWSASTEQLTGGTGTSPFGS
jgi:hypothetical protein